MAKTRHAKPDEFQKEQIRNLRKQLKQRDQKIRQLEKLLGYNQNRDESKKDSVIEELNVCEHCGKGFVVETVFEGIKRKFISCTVCDYKSRAIKI